MRPADVPAGSTARAVMEAAASAALARYREAIDLGTRRIDAERAYRDHILKAWDRTQARAAAEAYREQVMAADREALMRREVLDDELSARFVRKLKETAAAR